MKFKIGLICIFLSVPFLKSCNFNDNYVSPCNGKFGSKRVIEVITNSFGLKEASLAFRDSYKNGVGAPLSCDTITIVIRGDSIPIINSDVFTKSVSNIFFSESANKNVQFLKIEAESYWPAVGKLEVEYLLDRNSSINYLTSNHFIDTNYFPEFKILKEIVFLRSSAKQSFKVMKVEVILPTELKDVSIFAAEMKQKYNNRITEEKLDYFEIKIIIEKPFNKYCKSKSYHFFYERRSKELF